MPLEVGFVAGYALLLLAVSGVLHRLGRRNSAAWASPMLAGYRRQRAGPELTPPSAADWPHRDVGRLYTTVGLVAALAGGLLVVAESVRFHRPAELALLGPVSAVAVVVAARLAVRLRR
jgi:hypothetical protein